METEAEKQLKAGLQTAQAQGQTKVMPKHLTPTPEKDTTQNAGKTNIRTALKEAFEYADIDNSEEEFVVIKFPSDKFEIVRNLLDL